MTGAGGGSMLVAIANRSGGWSEANTLGSRTEVTFAAPDP